MAEETKVLLLQKCLDICQLFEKKDFDLSVSIGEFKFTMKHSSKNLSEKQKNKKKYVSPSTRRRNASRLANYKARKAAPSVEEVSPLEPPGVGGSPPGSLPGEEESSLNTRDDPTNLETRRVDVPLVVAVDVHPPPIPPPSNVTSAAKHLAKELALMAT